MATLRHLIATGRSTFLGLVSRVHALGILYIGVSLAMTKQRLKSMTGGPSRTSLEKYLSFRLVKQSRTRVGSFENGLPFICMKQPWGTVI